MAPLYQVFSLPGSSTQAFTITDGFVPASQSNSTGSGQNYNLTAFMVGGSDPGTYGQLNVYETPSGTTGPANADAEIDADAAVSKDISLLDQKGSEVLLGNTLMVPVGQSIIYLRPLYVAATTNPQPTLESVIGVLGHNVYIESTLAQTLSDIFNTTVSTSSNPVTAPTVPTVSGNVPPAVQADLNAAQNDYAMATAALQAGSLSNYQSDITAMEQQIANAQAALKAAATSTSTTTTLPPGVKGSKSTKTTKSTAPTSTEPRSSTTTTTLAAASAKP